MSARSRPPSVMPSRRSTASSRSPRHWRRTTWPSGLECSSAIAPGPTPATRTLPRSAACCSASWRGSMSSNATTTASSGRQPSPPSSPSLDLRCSSTPSGWRRTASTFAGHHRCGHRRLLGRAQLPQLSPRLVTRDLPHVRPDPLSRCGHLDGEPVAYGQPADGLADVHELVNGTLLVWRVTETRGLGPAAVSAHRVDGRRPHGPRAGITPTPASDPDVHRRVVRPFRRTTEALHTDGVVVQPPPQLAHVT